MEATETKTCKLCKLEIPAEARKCPHCLHWQNKFAFTNPAIFTPVIMLGMLFPIFASIQMMASYRDQGEQYEDHKGVLKVKDCDFSFYSQKCCKGTDKKPSPYVKVCGLVENSSDITWRAVFIEVTFYDKEGKIVDSTQRAGYDTIVPAHKSAAFSYSFYQKFPKDRYAKLKVQVVDAYEHDRP